MLSSASWDPMVADGHAAAVDAVATAVTIALLRLDLALEELAAEDLPPRVRAVAALLEGVPERLAGLGTVLTDLAR